MTYNRSASPAIPELEEARQRLDSLYENIAKAEEKLKGYKDLTDDVKSLEKTKEALNADVEGLKSKLHNLSKELSEKEIEYKSYFTEQEKKKTVLIGEMDALKVNVERLSKEMSVLGGKIENRIKEHESLVVRQEAEISALNVDISEARAKRDSLINEISIIEDGVSLNEKKNKALKEALEDLEKELDNVSKAKLNALKDVFESEKKIEDLKKEIEVNESKNRDALKAVDERKKADKEELGNIKASLDEKEKDLLVREKFVQKNIEKLKKYKSQMEEKYGERFPEIIL